MPPKGISSVTLNLRFMQNAARVEEEAEAAAGPSTSAAAATRVSLEDDSRWEIADSAKEGWGTPVASTSEQQAAVVHEQSYLPFLFAKSDDSVSTSGQKVRGRRQWNKRGQEVLEEERPVVADIKPSVSLSQLSSISGSAAGYIAPVRKDERRTKTLPPAKGKTALQAISQSGDVGTDLRRSKSGPSAPKSSISSISGGAPATFLKPAGVDTPSAKPALATDTSINGARSSKRERDGQGGDGVKRKKKKKAAVVADE